MERLEPRVLELKYCDICHRSEVDAIIEGGEEVIPMSVVDGLMVCDKCLDDDGPDSRDFPTYGNTII